MRANPLFAAIVAVAAAAPGAWAADAPAKSPRQCFSARSVNGFNARDHDNVYLRVGARDVYAFRMFGPCPDVQWSENLALVSRGGSDWICSGMDAELVVPSTIGPRRCAVRDIRKLTPAEAAAMAAGTRP